MFASGMSSTRVRFIDQMVMVAFGWSMQAEGHRFTAGEKQVGRRYPGQNSLMLMAGTFD